MNARSIAFSLLDLLLMRSDFLPLYYTQPRQWLTGILLMITSLTYATNITVDSINNDGFGSLRQAVLDASPGDTITFSPSIDGDTIKLTSGQILLETNIVIMGNGTTSTIIDGQANSRIFRITVGDTVSIDGVVLQNGKVTGTSIVGGGGAILNQGHLTLTNITVSGNSASLFGGGLYNRGTIMVTNSTVSGNSASNVGGGIYNLSTGTVTLTNSTVRGNSARFGGGIYNEDSGTVTLTNSTVRGNSATRNGGGVYNEDSGTVTLTNSTVRGNSATDNGGGIINGSGTVTLTNSTVSGNSASDEGGGIYSSGTLTVTNSIVAKNTDNGSGPDIYNVSGTITDGGHNLIGDGRGQSDIMDGTNGNQVGTTAMPLDPLFIMDVPANDSLEGDLRLQPCSPAINAGINDSLPQDIYDIDGDMDLTELLPYDLAGELRIFDNTVDIGAYEYQGAQEEQGTLVTNTNDDGCGSLRLAIAYAAPGDTIRFSPSIDGDTIKLTSGDISLNKKLVIIGYDATKTIIDGQANSRIFVISGVSVTLDGVTLQNGKANNNGGAINNNGRLTLSNSIVSGNSTNSNGGGIYNSNTMTLINSTVSGNTANVSGGGIVSTTNRSSTITLINSTVSGNTANVSGGGIFSRSTNNFFEFSTTSTSTVILINSIVGGNTANVSGGGIFNSSVNQRIRAMSTSKVILTNSTVSGNSATNSGGGIFSNSVNNHGGSSTRSTSTVTLTNSTVSGNSANNSGGGMFNRQQGNNSSSTVTLTNTIIAKNNDSGSCPDLHRDSGNIIDDGHNLIGDTTSVGSYFTTSILLGSSTDPLDPLFTMDVDMTTLPNVTGDLHLQCGSPAIDAGTLDTMGLNIGLVDLDSLGRIVDTIDIGAYEFQGFLPTWYLDSDGDGYTDSTSVTQCQRPTNYKLASELMGAAIDCDDTDAAIHPSATEICNGTDDNCNNQTDEGLSNTIIYVDSAATGANTGATWADAYTDLQSALDLSNCGDNQIWVAKGTYRPNATRSEIDRWTYYIDQEDTRIYGGFLTGDTEFSDRDWINNPTILSGDIRVPDDASDNSLNVIKASTYFILDGFIIEKGHIDEDLSDRPYRGGGLFISPNQYSALKSNGISIDPITIANCTFRNNTADSGGAIFIEDGPGFGIAVTIEDCIFENNHSYENGGAIHNSFGNVNQEFKSNKSSGISSTTIRRSVFRHNTTAQNGGAIWIAEPSENLTLKTTRIDDARFVISNSLFHNNEAIDGGAIYASQALPFIFNSTFTKNSASDDGGVLFLDQFDTSVSQFLKSNNSDHPIFINSILWDNGSSPIYFDIDLGSPFLKSKQLNSLYITHSIYDDGSPDGNVNIPIRFGNGGGAIRNKSNGINAVYSSLSDYDPLFIDSDNDDYRLQSCSPAVNTGFDLSSTTIVDINTDTLDLGLLPRVYENGIVDMGAYELQESLTTLCHQDFDQDTKGNADVAILACPTCPQGYVIDSTDCDDINSNINSTIIEICNGIDDNCDGQIDEGLAVTWYRDTDGDSFGDAHITKDSCAAPIGYVADMTDCNDADANVNSDAPETCNGIDDNCNGQIDESLSLAIVYVDSSAIGANNGSSWADAYTDMQSALSTPRDSCGTEVWVAKGTYYPTTGTNRNVTFNISGSDVKIYGGFAGTEVLRTERDWVSNPTILSGDIGSKGDISDNSKTVVRFFNVTEETVLDGFTIRDGNGGTDTEGRGGGIYIQAFQNTTTPSLSNCIIRNNSAQRGGGIAIWAGPSGIARPQFTNCVIHDNEASVLGSGLYGRDRLSGRARADLLHCTMVDNIRSNANIENSIIVDVDSINALVGGSQTVSNSIIQGTCNNCNDVQDVDPLFVDAINYNFELQECSPAINFGQDRTDVLSDYNGDSRPANGNYDIGAYEYQGQLTTTCYRDADGDGYGVDSLSVLNCGTCLPGYVLLNGDCNDIDGAIHPEATETCNGIDDNCNGQIDESLSLAIVYVDSSAIGANNGSSWTDAYTDMQSALSTPRDSCGTEVWVAKGTYYPTTGTNRNVTFNISGSDVKIYGGFAGTEVLRTERDWVSNPTILSGDIGSKGDISDNSKTVVQFFKVSEETVLDGFTIRDGNGGTGGEGRGGGIYVLASQNTTTPSLSNCIIRNNSAKRGGGIAIWGAPSGIATPQFTNCVIHDNEASVLGSGLYGGDRLSGRARADLLHCTMVDNIRSNANIENSIIVDVDSINALVGGSQTVSNSIIQGTCNNCNDVQDVDPLFVDAINYNFELQECSPAINFGQDRTDVTLDYNGDSRPANGNYDIGAYEYQGQLTTTCYRDADGDGYGVDSLSVLNCGTCLPGYVLLNGDCNDIDGAIHPEATEICNGIDDNCNGQIDESLSLAIVYVDSSAIGANNGSSWADAYTDMQSALSTPRDSCGTEVWVAKGTYYPTSDSNRDRSFNIRNMDITIYGGFSGVETMVEQRDWVANPTILSGNIGDRNVDSDNSKTVVRIQNVSEATELDGFIIEKGYGNANAGGIYIEQRGASSRVSATPTILNCVIRNNNGAKSGGVYSLASIGKRAIPKFINCIIYDNHSTENSRGSGFNCRRTIGIAQNIIINCTVVNGVSNRATIINSIVTRRDSINAINNSNQRVLNSIIQGSCNNCTDVQDVDPLFVDSANNNFELQECSPAINFGQDRTDVLSDYNGDPRPANGNYDIGAYEYQGQLTTTCYRDADGDGYGVDSISVLHCSTCLPGYVLLSGDCDDDEISATPVGVEICDGIDNDCDGLVDEGFITSIVENTNNDGCGSLRFAVLHANPGDTIWFDPSINGDTIQLTDEDIKIDKPLVIIGNGMDSTIISANRYSRIFRLQEDYVGTISNLTLTKGQGRTGGGIQNKGALSLSYVRFEDNRADDREGPDFRDNQSSLKSFSNYFGAAIYNDEEGNLTIQRCIFQDNHSRVEAGAIKNGGIMSVENSSFNNNTARDGGALWLIKNDDLPDSIANATIKNCTFKNNRATREGGAILNHGSTTIVGSLFSANVSNGTGGAILTEGAGSTMSIISSTLAANQAQDGGGLYAKDSLEIINSIVAANVANIGPDISNPDGTDIVSSYSLIQDTSGVLVTIDSDNGNIIGADPLFVNPDITIPSEDGDFRLSPCSPAIDAGVELLSGVLLESFDLDDEDRVAGGALDMGAYEYQDQLMCYIDEDGDGFGNIDSLILACDFCPQGYVRDSTDCDDTDPDAYPLVYSNLNIQIVIGGPQMICNNLNNITYSIAPVENVIYNWSYTGTGITFDNVSQSSVLLHSDDMTSGMLHVEVRSLCGDLLGEGDLQLEIGSNEFCTLASCDRQDIFIDNELLSAPLSIDIYKASNRIESNANIPDQRSLIFKAGQEIEFYPLFEVQEGGSLIGEIETCDNSLLSTEKK